jgi:hypothetical protein
VLDQSTLPVIECASSLNAWVRAWIASSRELEGDSARGGVGVGYRGVLKSVQEERLEEAKVFGVSLRPLNLSAIGCCWWFSWGRGGTGKRALSSSLDFFVFFRPKKDNLRFAEASERYPPSDSSSLVTAPSLSFFLGFFLDFFRVASLT